MATGTLLVIIIALDDAPYKILDKLKRAWSIQKQIWTSASSSVSQVSVSQVSVSQTVLQSQDQLADLSIQQITPSNHWDQQQRRLSNQAREDSYKMHVISQSESNTTATYLLRWKLISLSKQGIWNIWMKLLVA